MEAYKKPAIIGYNATRGIIPFAAIGAAAVGSPLLAGLAGLAGGAAAASLGAASVAGISATAAMAGGAAAALGGAAVGAAMARKGSKIIITEFTSALTERKDFSLA